MGPKGAEAAGRGDDVDVDDGVGLEVVGAVGEMITMTMEITDAC